MFLPQSSTWHILPNKINIMPTWPKYYAVPMLTYGTTVGAQLVVDTVDDGVVAVVVGGGGDGRVMSLLLD